MASSRPNPVSLVWVRLSSWLMSRAICIAWWVGTTGRIGCVDNPQNVISFCTGYGGLELGIRRTGVILEQSAMLRSKPAQANLVAKIEEGGWITPLSTGSKNLPCINLRGKIHGICGGYPCQPFSSSGKRKGEEDPRHLWPYIRKHRQDN